jgi:FixJ family two-component response regulator
MADDSGWIAIVDDDPGVLKALSRLLRAHGFRAQSFGSGREFLAALPDGLPVCLIVDSLMPEMTGLKVQQHLISTGIKISTILITAHGDAELQGFGEGNIVASFRKPVQEGPLLSAIERAIDGPPNAE